MNLCEVSTMYGLGPGHGFYGIMGFNFLFFLVTMGLILWVMKSPQQQKISAGSPVDILKRRYALGEIEKKEYLDMIKTLES